MGKFHAGIYVLALIEIFLGEIF